MKRYWAGKIKRQLTRYRSAVRLLLLTTLAVGLLFTLHALTRPAFQALSRLVRGPATAFSLVRNPSSVLRATRGRTNILLLGMGGADHQGAQLTDSLIVASIDLASTDTVLLSIPRDIWIASLRTKINAVYYYGEQKQAGGGLLLAKAAVEEVIGQPIHYAVALDFAGFEQAIDLLGGIDVEVPEAFDDYKYPIPGMEDAQPEELRYEHLHFDAGLQTMSGELALKYVRSRNAPGPQGTDFARSRRQQQVIMAFKKKALSAETIFSPTKLRLVVQTLTGSLKTDLSDAEYLSLAKLALQTKDEHLRSGFLEEADPAHGKTGLLINPDPALYDGQWVLVGSGGSWEEVQGYVESLFYGAGKDQSG